jgi:hypothetical protein
MPQGRAKKIQVQLLLADLPFQLFNPSLFGAGGWWWRSTRRCEPRPAA